MKQKTADKLLQKFARIHIQYQKEQSKIIKKLSDADLEFLANKFDKQALGGEPQRCFGFRVECWDIFANNTRSELNHRKTLRHVRELDLDCYCITCGGKCKGEEEHDKLIPSKTEYEMRLGEMSREELIVEAINLVHFLKKYNIIKINGIDI